ncbi:S8 family serine peptidase [Actinoplanes sp. NPDC023801]|uniref:S8 family serine peptidase n=1 Tax=Actinoplanes sp. NPDC023801 TaxID=3154595 RepID=UPI0034081AA3
MILLAPCAPAHADQVRDMQWFSGYLKVGNAHRMTKGGGVTVALVDSGVTPHIDLAKNLNPGKDTVPGGDGSGQVDDRLGHGTKMAGLIAGHGHSGNSGVLGIAPAARLMPIKSVGTGDDGTGVTSGIEWAATNGAKVINVSVAAPRGRALNEAISTANRMDAVVVAAVGNESDALQIAYPAAIPEVLAVGATDRDGRHAEFSITGPEVDICAPGVNIVMTFQRNKYEKGDGTSQATAIVSGAAALVRAKFPNLSAPEVIHRLTATARDNGPPGRDDQCGYGVLDIVKALTADVPPLSPSAGTGSGSSSPTGGASSAAGPSVPAGTGTSAGASPKPESAGSVVPVVAGVGAAVIALGTVLALLVRRRRRAEPPAPSA